MSNLPLNAWLPKKQSPFSISHRSCRAWRQTLRKRDVYCSYLAQSQIFIGIYGEKYGWIIPELKISGLEDEFQLSTHHPRLMYRKRPAPNRAERLKTMIDVILNSGVSCKFFSDTDDLSSIIENDLALLLTERFQQCEHVNKIIGEHSIIPIPAASIIWRDAEIMDLFHVLRCISTNLLYLLILSLIQL